MKKCKHQGKRYLRRPVPVYITSDGEFRGSTAETDICAHCGAWLPLGPSNDDDERVKVEIRAAEIAAALDDDRHLCDWTLSNETFMSFTAFEERRGWSIAESNTQHHSRAWLAGYLARCIAEHKEQP